MIAVTGANGLLGKFIVQKFLAQRVPVVAVVRTTSDTSTLAGFEDRITLRTADLLDVVALREALVGVDTVIHSAAVVSFNPRRKKTVFAVNVEGTRNVVDSCLALGVSRLIHVSSVAALGRQKGFPAVNEETKWVVSPFNSGYAESKYRAELEVFRGMEEGLSVSMVNPSVILAPPCSDRSSAQLFTYVEQGRRFYTDGSVNYVDARDVADIIFALYERGGNGEKVIASAGSIPLKNLLDEIAKRMNRKPPSVRVPHAWVQAIAGLEEVRCFFTGREPAVTRESARFAAESFLYDNSKAREKLGTKFRELAETIDWCCEAYLRKINTNK